MSKQEREQLITSKKGDVFKGKIIKSISRGSSQHILIEFTNNEAYLLVDDLATKQRHVFEFEEVDEVFGSIQK